jgi:hypothetical protein
MPYPHMKENAPAPAGTGVILMKRDANEECIVCPSNNPIVGLLLL